ncbi:ABC transporter permease [Niallia sp. NCCP-28]|uniref:ABC transporter permease n=1 Tax=Niallia sp. NCCP-28 TaxID=2934712 RepID=UPI0020837233|nr:ABC transporter permease [Niallia sp. NCCP-28]GKU81920.1 transport permease protein [Niallia sp. NCCP-28]
MKESSLTWAVTDGWTMFSRNLKHIFRNPESLIISMALPIILMLMFVYVFGGAIQTGSAYVNYVVPGIIITCVGYGSSTTAIGVNMDMKGGFFERLRSMPVHTSALLIGHVAGSFVRNIISTMLVILVALLIGFRPNANVMEWVGVMGMLSLFLLSLSWLAVLFGLLAKNTETASAFTFLPMFLPYISSAFVPANTMPKWLQFFSENQPMTPLIETLRGLLIGTPIGNNDWLAIVWFSGLLLFAFIMSIIVYKRNY